jgi:hypothetical protein
LDIFNNLIRFLVSPSAADNNLKCYLPTEMQFAPPKRCGLEAEILGKITKSFPQVNSAFFLFSLIDPI